MPSVRRLVVEGRLVLVLPLNLLDASAAASNYGGDEAGLICGFLFGTDGIGRPLGSAAAVQWLEGGMEASGFAWLQWGWSRSSR